MSQHAAGAVSSGSVLLRAARHGSASIGLQFGGQAADYMEELRTLYTDHVDACGQLIGSVAELLLAESQADEAKGISVHGSGFDLQQWLDDWSSCPPVSYLRSAPISYPLIALTQLCNYMAAIKSTNTSLSDMADLVDTAIGHSQGIASAVVVAWSNGGGDFETKATQMIRLMFWHGVRVQQVYRAKIDKLPPAQSITPMLAVIGLPVKRLEHIIGAVNKKLSAGSMDQKASVSLVNGNLACVVSGPIEYLKFLHGVLSSMSCGSSSSKGVPYYQRKPKITLRFLKVSAPFHCGIIADAVPLIAADAVKMGLNILGKDLNFPVLATTTQAINLQSLGDESILPTLICMQTTQPVDWPAVVARAHLCTKNKNLNASSNLMLTHILDFGPGGEGGVASLTSRCIEDMGSQVVTVLASPSIQPQKADTESTALSLQSMELLLSSDHAILHTAPRLRRKSAVANSSFWPQQLCDNAVPTVVMSVDSVISTSTEGYVTVGINSVVID